MKPTPGLLASLLSVCALSILQAQPPGFAGGAMSGPPKGPRLDGAMAELFGEHKAFSAVIEFESVPPGQSGPMRMPGKIAFLNGKSRFEMDMAKMSGGGSMPPQAGAQLKAMGLAEVIAVTLPEEKLMRLVYPGLKSYTETALSEEDAGQSDQKYETTVTELGKETVDDHPCIKNKVTVSDGKGSTHEATVWNAADMKKFPVKIEYTQKGQSGTIRFRDVNFDKPAAKLYDAPEGFTKYATVQEMMMKAMMERFGGGGAGGFPRRP